MRPLVARTEFAAAVNQLANERGVDPEVVIETIKTAILAAFKRDVKETGQSLDEELIYEVQLDPGTGATKVFCWSEGDEDHKQDITPPGFGRIAAQTAKQVILQKIREAEKAATITQFEDKVNTLVNGMILRFDGHNIIVALGKAEAVLPPFEQVIADKYRLNQHLTFYIDGIRQSAKGQEIIVSRATKELVKLLFEREVPEVASKAVVIKAIAREPGNRTKVAVYSTQSGVDPVGSCVGQKGVRVQAVIDEISGEKLDIIQYDEDPVKFISAAIAPADVTLVTVDKDRLTAKVVVPDDQLSLAIGKEGQNVRLAAKLTGYKLDILGASGAKPTSSHPTTDNGQGVEKAAEETKNELEAEGLSTKIARVLSETGINKIEELKGKDEKELKAIKGIGPKAIEEIKKIKEK